MKKKDVKYYFSFITIIFLFCFSLLISSYVPSNIETAVFEPYKNTPIPSQIIMPYVSGPPAGSTNAPGNNTCYGSPACHGGTPNTGPGFAEITVMGGVPAGNYYLPDSSYAMMPYIVDTAKIKGGFQVVALLDNGLNAGTSTVTLPMNTQLISSGGYDYIEQTATGAVKPVMSNMHDWMYDWKAPPVGSGKVTFYVSFIAANGNGAPSGDNIYTDTLVLYEGSTGINDIYTDRDFAINKVYPMPSTDFTNINFNTNKNLNLNLSVINLEGAIVISEKTININPVNKSYQLNLKQLKAGIYFIKLTQKGKPALQYKIIKN